MKKTKFRFTCIYTKKEPKEMLAEGQDSYELCKDICIGVFGTHEFKITSEINLIENNLSDIPHCIIVLSCDEPIMARTMGKICMTVLYRQFGFDSMRFSVHSE